MILINLKKSYLARRFQHIKKSYEIKNTKSPGFSLLKSVMGSHFSIVFMEIYRWSFIFDGYGVITNGVHWIDADFTAKLVLINNDIPNTSFFNISGKFSKNKLNGPHIISYYKHHSKEAI